jgi:hypothetical protein
MTSNIQEPIHEDRVWSDEHWTARVVKNDDDDGWAVAMYLDGEVEPALVGPWTMGRDKKNPKPRVRVALAIVPDEEGATATLSATNEFDEALAVVSVPPSFKLTVASAEAWVASGFERPQR